MTPAKQLTAASHLRSRKADGRKSINAGRSQSVHGPRKHPDRSRTKIRHQACLWRGPEADISRTSRSDLIGTGNRRKALGDRAPEAAVARPPNDGRVENPIDEIKKTD